MKKLLQNLKENLPVYVMIFLIFVAAIQYIPWKENIIVHLIDGFFLVFAAWLGVSTYSKNREDVNESMRNLENAEEELKVSKKLLEHSFKSFFNRKREPLNGYEHYIDMLKIYNRNVKEYKVLVNKINTLFNSKLVPKFSYATFNDRAESLEDAIQYEDVEKDD